MQDLFIEFLPPWVETGLQPAFYDRESGSVLQQTARMYAKVNELVKAVNGMDKIIKEYVEYIDNYFKNLDVQEEINNKLDDMLESGELETAIAQFLALAPVFAYDTVADMVDSDYLATGCIARTLGKEAVNDGLGAYYRIGDTGDIELDNGKFATKVGNNLNTTLAFNTLNDLIEAENIEAGYTAIVLGKETLNDGYGAVYTIGDVGDVALDNGLYATLQNDFGNNYYNEITISTGRDYDTDYYVATIPLNDADGNQISPYVNDETDTHTRGTLQYAQDEFTTLSLNAGLGRQDSHGTWIQGAVISNGVITRHDENDITAPDYYSYMGIKADRTVVNFPGTTTPEAMLATGVVNAFMTFGQVVTNGILTINEERSGDGQDPLVFLGTKQDGTMIIVVFDGRTEHDYGINVTEGASKMLELGCTNAWNLDGGGSSSLVYKGSKQNRNIDEHGTKDRGIWVTLNFKKPTINKELAKAFSFIGKERQLLNKQIRDDIYETYKKRKAFLYLQSVNANTGNTIADSETPIILKFATSYTYDNDNYIAIGGGSVFELLTDSNNYITGIKFHKPGLYKVTITADVYCANTDGYRETFMTIEDGVTPIGQSQVWDYIDTSASNQTHLMSSTFVFNNAVFGNTFHINAGGQVGDGFHRVYVTIEDIGPANSNR